MLKRFWNWILTVVGIKEDVGPMKKNSPAYIPPEQAPPPAGLEGVDPRVFDAPPNVGENRKKP